MSSLTLLERRQLEKLFQMSSGYVLHFSDATFGDFFADTVAIDIHAEKYQTQGTSKAKKLRAFWQVEPDQVVGQVVLELVAHAAAVDESSFTTSPVDVTLVEQCREIGNRLMTGSVNLTPLKQSTAGFDAKHLAQQIKRLEQSVQADPSLAIGTAKELIETCCKTILADHGKEISSGSDIPTLTKATLRELQLVPEGIHEATRGHNVIKRLLLNLGTIGNNLAELRGLYGTGHGKHAETEGLAPRHAKLAVGAATTLVTFLFETHMARSGSEGVQGGRASS